MTTIGIIGIDCATQPKKTGLAFGYFEGGKAAHGSLAAGGDPGKDPVLQDPSIVTNGEGR
jgi:hypothetical protein